MLFIYLVICTLLLGCGLLTEKYVMKNKIEKGLVIFHVFMWYTPILNIGSVGIMIYHLMRKR